MTSTGTRLFTGLLKACGQKRCIAQLRLSHRQMHWRLLRKLASR